MDGERLDNRFKPLHDKATANKTDHFDATGCDETITFHVSLHL